jgi:hypothetical protein
VSVAVLIDEWVYLSENQKICVERKEEVRLKCLEELQYNFADG